MGDEMDNEIKRALNEKARRERDKESFQLQASDLWGKLKKEVKRGVEKINQSDESIRLVGSPLKFEQADLEFKVEKYHDPGRRLTCRNCDKFLSVEVVALQKVRGDVVEKEEDDSPEDLHFKADGSGHVYLENTHGREFYKAEEIALYLLKRFWS